MIHHSPLFFSILINGFILISVNYVKCIKKNVNNLQSLSTIGAVQINEKKMRIIDIIGLWKNKSRGDYKNPMILYNITS